MEKGKIKGNVRDKGMNDEGLVKLALFADYIVAGTLEQ